MPRPPHFPDSILPEEAPATQLGLLDMFTSQKPGRTLKCRPAAVSELGFDVVYDTALLVHGVRGGLVVFSFAGWLIFSLPV